MIEPTHASKTAVSGTSQLNTFHVQIESCETGHSRRSGIDKHGFDTKDRLRRIRLETPEVGTTADETTDGTRYRKDLSEDPTSMAEREVFGP